MSDPVTNVEIEDVLSSIRRLVSENARAQSSRLDEAEPADRPGTAEADRLVLTPALRVEDESDADLSAAEPSDEASAAPESLGLPEDESLATDDKEDNDASVTPRVLTLSSNLPRFLNTPLTSDANEDDPVEIEKTLSHAFDDAAEDPEMVFETYRARRVTEDAASETAPEEPEESLTDWYAMRADAIEAEYRPIEPELDTEDKVSEPSDGAELKHDAPVEEIVAAMETPESAADERTPDSGIEGAEVVAESVAESAEPEQAMEVEPGEPDSAAEISEVDPAEAEPETIETANGAEKESEPLKVEVRADNAHDIQRTAESEDSFYLSPNLHAVRRVSDSMERDGSNEDAAEQEPERAEDLVIEGTAEAQDEAVEPQAYEAVLDEEMLRDLVGEIVRQELQGPLGERITRNVRKLVRREINRALATRQLD